MTTETTNAPLLCLPRKRTPEEVEDLKKSYLSLLSHEDLVSLVLLKDKDPTVNLFPDDLVGTVATLKSRTSAREKCAPNSPSRAPVSGSNVTQDIIPTSTSPPREETRRASVPAASPIAHSTSGASSEAGPKGHTEPQTPLPLPQNPQASPPLPSPHPQHLPFPIQPIQQQHPSLHMGQHPPPFMYAPNFHASPPHPPIFQQPLPSPSQLPQQGSETHQNPSPSHLPSPVPTSNVAQSFKGRGASSLGNGMPSYEEMLVMAITELKDPEGSTPKNLFEWMISRFPLVNNFRPSAHQALQKAFKRGRLERIGTKYRLNSSWEGGSTSRRTTRRPQVGNGVPAVTPLPARLPGFPWPLPGMAPGGVPGHPHMLSSPQAHPPHLLTHPYAPPLQNPPPDLSQPIQPSNGSHQMAPQFQLGMPGSTASPPAADALLQAIGAINGMMENASAEDDTGAMEEEDDEAGNDGGAPSGGKEQAEDNVIDVDGSEMEYDDEDDTLLSATLDILAEQMRLTAAALDNRSATSPTLGGEVQVS